jgi:DNA-binding MarR family transcriptional regulator
MPRSKGGKGGKAARKALASKPTIDKLVHEPARYTIMAHLYVVEEGDFLYLRTQTGLTDGNLSSHLGKLEKGGYVKVKKMFVGKKPHTMLSLTKSGRKAFEEYRRNMERMLREFPTKK